jgi:hypothetical protein
VEDGITYPHFVRIRDPWGEALKSKKPVADYVSSTFLFLQAYASKLSTPLKNKTVFLRKPVF